MNLPAYLLTTSSSAALSLLLCSTALGGVSPTNVAVEAPRSLPACGTTNAPPRAQVGDAVKPRECLRPTPRTYSPKFQTIGHEVLRSESAACFVPDSAFEQLDAVIEQGQKRYKEMSREAHDWKGTAIPFFQAMGVTLLDFGYQLYIPTQTLADALVVRPLTDSGKYIEDCDTASLMYMSTAEVLGLPVSMVEIQLASGAGHNYVRWVSPDGETIDWDTNGREQCVTPSGLPSWQGRTMSRMEILGYIMAIRGSLNQKSGRVLEALTDYRDSVAMYPRSPFAHNNLAWLLATRPEFHEPARAREAVERAMAAVSIERSANNLDTLACAHSRDGNFASAESAAKEAITLAPSNQAFKLRLKGFQSAPPQNCVGVD